MIPLSQIFCHFRDSRNVVCFKWADNYSCGECIQPALKMLTSKLRVTKNTTLFDCFHVNRLKLCVDERCFTWSHTFHPQNFFFLIFHLHTTSGPINIRMSASTHRTRAVYLRSWDKHWSILFMLWCHCNWLFDLLLLFSLLLLSLVLPFWPRFLFYIAVTHSQ